MRDYFSMPFIDDGDQFVLDRLRNDLLKNIDAYTKEKKKISQRRASDIKKMKSVIQDSSLGYSQIRGKLSEITKKMETGVTGRSKLKGYVMGVFKEESYQEVAFLRIQNKEVCGFIKGHRVTKDLLDGQRKEEGVGVIHSDMIVTFLAQLYCMASNSNWSEKERRNLESKVSVLEKKNSQLSLENIRLSNENRLLRGKKANFSGECQHQTVVNSGEFFQKNQYIVFGGG